MRIGKNPKKEDRSVKPYGLHRLIMPVYIPKPEGYYAEALEIFRLCLESLYLTKKPETAITIIANGCCEPVLAILLAEHKRGWIDQLLINQENRGHLDPMVGAGRGCFEPIVTFADSDVLFRRGWDAAVERVFRLFPECGFVCPIPIPDMERSFASAALLAGACDRALSFEEVADPTELEIFHKSIGRAPEKLALLKLGQLIFTRGGEKVCIGGGHFVCSFRRDVFRAMPAHPALVALGTNEEYLWLDASPDRLGYWKLSTTKAYVQHMGNRLEPYMVREVSALRAQPPVQRAEMIPLQRMRRHWTGLLPYWFRARLGARVGFWLRERGRKRAVKRVEGI